MLTLILTRGWVRVSGSSAAEQALIRQHFPKVFPDHGILKLPAFRYPQLVSLLDQNGVRYERRFALPIPPGFRVSGIEQATKLRLYPFQLEGASFLVHARRALLADGTGLGKTIQSLAAASHLYRQGIARRGLVLTPTSVKLQWADEAARFTDLPCLVVHGEKEERLDVWKRANRPTYTGLVIANWELIHHDTEPLRDYARSCELVVLDEAERIRNYKSKTAQFIQDFAPPYRWALTATPLQVRVEELYSIMRWIDPYCFGFSPRAFLDRYCVRNQFGQAVRARTSALPELRARVAPYLLRREESEVADQLPEMEEQKVRVYMTPVQTMLHAKVRDSLRELLQARDEDLARILSPDLDSRERARLLHTHDRLGQIILGRFALLKVVASHPQALRESRSPFVQLLLKDVDPRALAICPKLEWVLDRLQESSDRQVVVFSEFARVARLAYDAIASRGIPAVFESGETPAADRQAAQQLFQIGAARVFVSTDAGSRGINLQAGAEVIHLDLPWNPSTLTQRNGRIRRLGSRHSRVRSVRLLSAGSIDEQVNARIYERQQLFDALVNEPARLRSSLTRRELAKLLDP